jgi:hypothetical protein
MIPDSCTLPLAERPLRLADVTALFTRAHDVERRTPTHARLRLAGEPGLTSRVRDLAARETQCCPFFRFTVTPEPVDAGEALVLDIEVPPAYADVLRMLLP